MKAFFYTSAIVPLFLSGHESHRKSVDWLGRVRRGEVRGFLALHSVAESYRTLSTPTGRPPLEGELLVLAMRLLLDGSFEIVEPRASDYRNVVVDLARRHLPGKIVYDALLLQAARRSGAEVILTFNLRDFRRAAPDLEGRIREP